MNVWCIIFLLSSYFCYAGVLPQDFNFKPATDERVSFIKQFKDYEQAKEQEAIEQCNKQKKEILEHRDENRQSTMFEKCKNFLIYLITLLSYQRQDS